MKKKIVISFMMILLLFSITAQDKPIITVLDFETEAVSEQEMKSVISLFSSALFNTGKYRVIDTSERDTILNEMEFSLSSCSDETCQIDIGKMLSAEMIVVGSLGTLGSKYILSSKILETGTGQTIRTADRIYADLDELVNDLFRFAGELSGLSQKQQDELAEKKPEEKKAISWKPFVTVPTLVGGIGLGGFGGYLIYSAIQYYTNNVEPAWTVYNNASEEADFDSLHAVYQSELDIFKEKFITASVIAGGGVVLLAVSAIVFSIPDKRDEAASSLSFSANLLNKNIVALSFNYKF